MNDIEQNTERPTLVRYKILTWVCSLSMLTYVDRVCIKELSVDMRRDLGISDSSFAWVYSAFFLSYAVLELPSGWMGDRLGPRRVLFRIVLMWSIFTALTGLVWPFSFDSGYLVNLPRFGQVPLVFNALVLLMLIRFAFGAGEAGAYPNIARSLRNWFNYRQRGMTQGLVWTCARFGGSLASILVFALSASLGWRGTFVTFGALGILWVTVFFILFRDRPDQHPGVNEAELKIIQGGVVESVKPPPLSWSRMLSSPSLWFLSLMYFCGNAGWSFFITWDVDYYRNVLHLSQSEQRFASSAPLFFGGIACFMGGFLTDRLVRSWGPRWGRTLLGSLSYIGSALFFLAALYTQTPLLAVAFLCSASFVKDLSLASTWATSLDIGQRYSGTVSGFMNMVGNLGQFVASPVVVYLASLSASGASDNPLVPHANWQHALTFSACMYFISAIAWLFINPRKVIVYAPPGTPNS